MRRQNGFSMIELLMVVAILLIVAALAVPNYWKARISANESAAASSIRTINTAEVAYLTAYPQSGYADLTSLSGPTPCVPSSTSACLLDNSLAMATAAPGRSGYIYLVNVVSGNYVAAARPASPGMTGNKTMCSVNDSVVRFDANGAVVNTVSGCVSLPTLH